MYEKKIITNVYVPLEFFRPKSGCCFSFLLTTGAHDTISKEWISQKQNKKNTIYGIHSDSRVEKKPKENLIQQVECF